MQAIAENVNTFVAVWAEGLCWEFTCDNGVWKCLSNGNPYESDMVDGYRIVQHIQCIEQFPFIPLVMEDKMYPIDTIPEKLMGILISGTIQDNYHLLEDLIDLKQMTVGRLLVEQGNRRVGGVYGAYWDTANSDRISKDAQKLTVWDIVRFYTNQYGVFDALQFVSFRDLATNCAKSMRNRVYSFHNQKQLQSVVAIVNKQDIQIRELRSMVQNLATQLEALKKGE